MDWLNQAGVWWLIAAVMLAGTELLVPGVFLVFLALAAAATGAITLFFPELSIGGQLMGFAGWSLVMVLIGRRWYRDYPVDTSDPLLNNRAARLIGETLTLTQPIAGGQGRVRVGDGEWIACGPDAPAGSLVRVVDTRGASLVVEIVSTPLLPAA